MVHRTGREWLRIAQETYEVQQLRKEYSKKEKDLLEKLKMLSQNKNSYGDIYMFTVAFRKGSIAYKQIPELKKVDLEPYRNQEVAIWKLTQEEN